MFKPVCAYLEFTLGSQKCRAVGKRQQERLHCGNLHKEGFSWAAGAPSRVDFRIVCPLRSMDFAHTSAPDQAFLPSSSMKQLPSSTGSFLRKDPVLGVPGEVGGTPS